MSSSKPPRPNLRPYIPPINRSPLKEKPELSLYGAMYANKRNQRLLAELSADIDSEIEKIINDMQY